MPYSYALVALVLLLIGLAFRYSQHKRVIGHAATHSIDEKNSIEQENPLAAYDAIEPLPNFDWKSTPPIKIRPFKPKYHLTMGLSTIPLSDLLQMDNTYLSRIQLRRQLIDSHPEATLACNPVAEPAALELYEWLMGTYLPKRLPTCYTLVDLGTQQHEQDEQTTSSGRYTHLLNKVTAEHISLHEMSPLAALRTISAHIDTDFLILLPNQQQETKTKTKPETESTPQQTPSQDQDQDQDQPPTPYHLEAFATTFPSGFSTLSKLSLPLSSIHAPVPSYASKLGKSMDRFFMRLETGKLVLRTNWTITTTPELFTQSGTHMHETAAQQLSEAEWAADILEQQRGLKVEEMRLRCERQTLMRLPRSGAVVFAFKTYSYALEEVRGEGSGEALAKATEGFTEGSVPEMEFYKRAVVWGDVVRGFLRS